MRALVFIGLLLSSTSVGAQDDDGWIDVEPDSAVDDGEGWIDVDPSTPEEGQASPAAPTGGEADPNAAPQDPPAAASAAPEAPAPNAEGPVCPPIDLAAPKDDLERVIVLPLQDSAANPEAASALTDATRDGLQNVTDFDFADPGQIERAEDGTLITPTPPEPVRVDRLRFQVIDGRCLGGVASDEVFESIQDCSRSTCLGEIAGPMKADFIVYGQLANAPGGLLLYEVKLYDAAKNRIVSRATAEAPNPLFLVRSVPNVLDQLVLVPDPPPPRAPTPIEPTVLESPLFIGGAAVTLAGVVLAVGTAAWLIDAELKLGTPEAHRDLKVEALTYWRYVAVAGAVAPFIIAAGVGAMIASPFFLPSSTSDDPATNLESAE